MHVLAGSSNPSLAHGIAEHLGTSLVDAELSQFSNGERRVWIKDSVKGENVALIQSLFEPVDEHIMELLLMIDALERIGARHVNVIIPWMGYSLQDKVFRDGEPIAAKVVANLISNSYTKRAFLLDLHNTSTPGFFSIPTTHLSAADVFAAYLRSNFDLQDAVIASPDFGGLKRARVFADSLGLDLVNIDKHRNLHTGSVTAVGLHGSVEGKRVFLYDDVILSGGTVVEGTALLKDEGAAEVHFLATHGLFVNNAWERLDESDVDSVIVTNSIEQHHQSEKLKVIDVADVFGQALATWS